jgi:hypothetical protein
MHVRFAISRQAIVSLAIAVALGAGLIPYAAAAPQRPAEFISSDEVLTWINGTGTSPTRSGCRSRSRP